MPVPVSRVADVRVTGRLAPFVSDFRVRLQECGYTPLTTVNMLRLMLDVSRWLDDPGWMAGDLTGVRVEEFLRDRRAAGHTSSFTPRSLTPLIELLTEVGVLAVEAPVVPCSSVEVLSASFHRYLLAERALAGCTALAYVARARRFLAGCAADGDLGHLLASDVTAAVQREAGTVSIGSPQFLWLVSLRYTNLHTKRDRVYR